MRKILYLFFLTGLLGLCACDELFEAVLCKEASQKLCDKQFTCFPNIASVAYGTLENCEDSWRAWCDSAEASTGCELDNSQLAACRDGIEASVCGQYPPDCTYLLNCYEE